MTIDNEFFSAFKAIKTLQENLKNINRYAVDVREIKKEENIEQLKNEIKRLKEINSRVAIDENGDIIPYAIDDGDRVLSISEYTKMVRKKEQDKIVGFLKERFEKISNTQTYCIDDEYHRMGRMDELEELIEILETSEIVRLSK